MSKNLFIIANTALSPMFKPTNVGTSCIFLLDKEVNE